MIAPLEQQHRRGRRPHAGGESQAVFRRLQTRQRGLQRRTRGIVRPRVIVSLMDSRRALRKGAGLKYRNGDRAGGRFGFLSGVNGARGKSPALPLVCPSELPAKVLDHVEACDDSRVILRVTDENSRAT